MGKVMSSASCTQRRLVYERPIHAMERRPERNAEMPPSLTAPAAAAGWYQYWISVQETSSFEAHWP
jgi:hypothetical protein